MGRHGRPSRSGFTIIEVTVVLLLIAAIAGVVLPTLAWRSDDRLFIEACRRLETAAEWARVEARQQDQALQLVALRRDGRWVLVLRPWADLDGDELEPDDAPLRETVLTELPRGLELEEVQSDDTSDMPMMPEVSAETTVVSERVICVALSDGPGPASDPLQLVAKSGRTATFQWMPWSNSLRVTESSGDADQSDPSSNAPAIEDAFVPFPMEQGG